MRVIVAGSRTIDNYNLVENSLLDSPWAVHNLQYGKRIEEIVHGGADGVDTVAGEVAENHDIPVKVFEAQWGKYGKAAGPERNRIMAEYADGLVAVWDGSSPGTRDMIEKAISEGLSIYINQPNGEEPKKQASPIRNW